ncbi:MAG: N-acetylglucosamine-6-phosphate deacetylase, partial [Ilumatobacteraceae bacterium]
AGVVIRRGAVHVDGPTIVGVGGAGGTLADGDIDADGGWIVPGFVDVQINGAHGIDVTTQPRRIDELGSVLTRYGVTAFVPTVITCGADVRAAALAAWPPRPSATAPSAVPLGLHLEGPMLSPVRTGAHPAAHLTAPSTELIEGWSPEAGVVMVTLAPELPGALDVVGTLVSRGVTVSMGHTDATAAEFAAGRVAGASYVTHLFNAMRPFGHRDPGPIGAALADPEVVVGLVCDGVHVDPVAVAMAWRALGPHRLNLVTDAVSAMGAATVGTGSLGSVGITVGADGVRNADGVLAGSLLSLDQAVRNLIDFTGCAVPEAVATVTSTPAHVLGLADRGRLVVGARADVTVLDRDLRVRATIVGGQVAWRS